MDAAVQRRGTVPRDAQALLYREAFGLTFEQMQQEPVDVVTYWLALEEARQKEQQRQTRSH